MLELLPMKQGVILKKGREKFFEHRHPWIFSGAIEAYPDDFEEGQVCPVLTWGKQLLGYAYFHSKISLSGRIVSFGKSDPMMAIRENLLSAIQLREKLLQNPEINAYRLVNGEGDRLPGLIIDKYDDALVLQSGTLGMDRLKTLVGETLAKTGKCQALYEKSTGGSRKEESLQDQVGVLWGEDRGQIPIIENGLKFLIDWRHGQKTGFFLDQRPMRELVLKYGSGRKVLNAFAYTGGFSLYALKGGAVRVDSIDISERAVSAINDHMDLNRFERANHRAICQDVFQFLSKEELEYDFVILDPPAFAKKKKDIPSAINGYRAINRLAMEKMPKQSLLLTCSCSYYVDESMFREMLFQAACEAKREVKIIGRHVMGIDHPINIYHPESDYLKSLLLYLD